MTGLESLLTVAVVFLLIAVYCLSNEVATLKGYLRALAMHSDLLARETVALGTNLHTRLTAIEQGEKA